MPTSRADQSARDSRRMRRIARDLEEMAERCDREWNSAIERAARTAGAYLRDVFDQPTFAGEVEVEVRKLKRAARPEDKP